MKKKFYLLVALSIIALSATTIVLFSIKDKQKPLPALVDAKIIIRKSERTLELYSNNQLVRTYKIALGSNPDEDKTREGDGSTPLGEFYVSVKNINH
jgi:murein L,D-transpeptidase YafK